MKKRAVGYCRISTLMQVDNTSLKDQEDKIKMYAKLHDIVIDKIFIDKAVSGGTPIAVKLRYINIYQ
ncbi:MAG: recombinase family protein [Peptostreptococcaceae bacterium]